MGGLTLLQRASRSLPYAEYEIREEDGYRRAVGEDRVVIVLTSPEPKGIKGLWRRLRRKVRKEGVLTHERTKGIAPGRETSMLRAELAGAYLYVAGDHILLTEEEVHIQDVAALVGL